MSSPKIILASSSPRRRQLLEQTGLAFETVPSSYEEEMHLPMPPRTLARYLAFRKAQAVATELQKRGKRNCLVVGADTLVVCNGKLFGKPADAAAARKTLRTLSNNVNIVITGFAIIDTATGRVIRRAVVSKVYFKKLTRKEIDEYIATGDPFDKSGAYSVSGKAKHFIRRVEGDINNVIGLPVNALMKELKNIGFEMRITKHATTTW